MTFSVGAGEEVASIEAEAGETINVHVAPQADHRLNALSSTPEVTFAKSESAENLYSFTMPESNVEVSATFDEAHSVSVSTVGYYNNSPTITGLDTSAKHYAGEELSFTVTPYSYYDNITSANTLIYVNDEVVANALTVNDEGIATVTIAMPDEDAEIIVCSHSSTVYDASQGMDGGVYIKTESVAGAKIYGFLADTKYVYFTGHLEKDSNFSLTGIEYKINDAAEWTSSAVNSYEGAVRISSGYTNSSFTINFYFSSGDFADGDTVTIRPAGEIKEVRNITYVNTDHLTEETKAGLVSSALPGENVTIRTIEVEDGYYISDVTADNESAQISYYEHNGLTFTMPDADLTITFNVLETGKINITLIDGIAEAGAYEDYYLEDPITSASPNSYFYFKIVLADGYSLNSVTLTADDGTTQVKSGYDITNYSTHSYCSFSMPSSGDATITFDVSRLSAISFVSNESIAEAHASIYPYSTSASVTSIAGGSSFYVFADPVDGKRVTKATMNDTTTVEPSGVSYGYQYFAFTAPASGDISISFETTDNGTIKFTVNSYTSGTPIIVTDPYSEPLAANGVLPGESFYVGLTAIRGYLPISATMNGGTPVTNSISYNGVVYFPFTMPTDGSDVTISFEFGEAYSVTTDVGEGGSIRMNGGPSFAAGSKVTFTVSTDSSFYSISELKVTTASGTAVECAPDYEGSTQYSFTMPEENVTISVTFDKQPTATVALSHTDNYTSDIVTMISANFSPSYKSIYYYSSYGSAPSAVEVAVGETMRISLSMNYTNYSNYKVEISYVVNGVTTTETVDNSNSSYITLEHTVEEGLTEFYFTFTSNSLGGLNPLS